MKVNILLLTIDRLDHTRTYVGEALKNAGHPYQLCVTDNGSKVEREVIDLVRSWKPALHIINDTNKGTAQSLNRMIREYPAEAYVFIGNDIQMPHGWLKTLVEYADAIPQSGVVGIDWRGLEYPKEVINGKTIKVTTNTFGTMFVTQSTRDKVGEFCEDYGPYGLWDSDYSLRCTAAGLRNYYVDGLTTTHQGHDVGQDSEYRRMKDASLKAASPIFNANRVKYEQGDYFRTYAP